MLWFSKIKVAAPFAVCTAINWASSESNPNHSYNEPGTYQVQLIGFSACSGDTMSQEILIENPTSGIQTIAGALNYSIRKTSNTELILDAEETVSLSNLSVLDVVGRRLGVNIIQSTTNSIRFNVNQKGPVLIYFELNGDPQFVRIYN